MLFQTMFALAFHAFFRIGEITVCTKSDNYEHLLKVDQSRTQGPNFYFSGHCFCQFCFVCLQVSGVSRPALSINLEHCIPPRYKVPFPHNLDN